MRSHRLVIREEDRNVFDEIASGRKSIETRAATDKYRKITVGDSLTFTCGADSLTKIVTKAAHYESVDDMYKHLPVDKVLPFVNGIEEAKRVHLSFPGYKEKLATFGIMAFELG